jgi:acetolactate synthase-1/2/3 large subunit
MAKVRCAKALVNTLEAVGIQAAFVYNGHGNWALLDAIEHESQIQGIAGKSEEQCVHMADGYYRSQYKGRPAIVSTSVGPGNMNIASALANAFFESSALLVLAGGGSTHWSDRGGIEEFYRYAPDEWIQSVKTYSKKALVINRPDTAIEMLLRAYKTAITGRPGPVVLQIPFDIQHSDINLDAGSDPKRWVDIHPPGPDIAAVQEAAKLISNSERPLVIVSSGIYRSNAFKELSELLESYGLPLVTTTMGKGAYPEDKPLCQGAIGRSGTENANHAAEECDLLLAIGIHFSDVDTGGWTLFQIPSSTRLVHIDIDSSEICRVYPTEVGILSDAKPALRHLIEELKSLKIGPDRWATWRSRLEQWKDQWEETAKPLITSDRAPLNYARLCHDVSTVVNDMCPEASIFVDTGHLLSFAPPFYKVTKPKFFHNGFFHRMGWSLPAAFGARIANPKYPAVALMGDGSYLFSCTTLATAYEHDVPLVAIVLNNKSLQIERELMHRLYGRTAFVDFKRKSTNTPWNPNLMAIAAAMGAQAEKVATPEELAPAVKKALESEETFVIDVDIDVESPGYRSVWYPYPNNFWTPLDEMKKRF